MLLHRVEYLLIQNGRYAVLLHDAGVTVDPDVIVIRQDAVKAVLVPPVALLCFQAAAVQLVRNVDEGHAIEHHGVDLPHQVGLFRLDGILPVLALHIAQRQRSVHLAGLGVVPHTAPDVLGHILGVELIHIHHGAEGEAPGRGGPELLFGIERLYAEHIQLRLILEGLQHVPGDAV